MRDILFIFLVSLIFADLTYGQDKNGYYDTQYSFNQKFSVSPKQRKLISIEFPVGTSSIIYRITVGKKNQEIGQSLVNVVSSIPNPYTAVTGALTKFIVNLTNYEAVYYVFPSEQDANNYKNGLNFNYCITTGELTNATVKLLSNNCYGSSKYLYFGFNTNEMLIDYHITLEVIPWVEKPDLTIWSVEKKNELFKAYKQNLIAKGVSESIAIEITTCILNKLTTTITPLDASKMGDYELNNYLKKITEICGESLQGGPKTEEQEKGKTYGSMGWKAFQNGEIDKAIEFSKKALSFDNTLGWVEGNLGLFYLIKGDEMQATEYYVNAISNIKKDKLNSKNIFKEVINDINNAIKKYPDLRGYNDILKQLQLEYDKN